MVTFKCDWSRCNNKAAEFIRITGLTITSDNIIIDYNYKINDCTFNKGITKFHQNLYTEFKHKKDENFSDLECIKMFGDITDWDVSLIKNMKSGLYDGYSSSINPKQFNSDISKWDVSNVTDIRNLFGGNSLYFDSNLDLNLSNWNTTKITEYKGFAIGTNLCNNICNLPKYLNNKIACNKQVSILDDSNIKSAVNEYIKSNNCGKSSPYGNIEAWDTSNVKSMKSLFFNLSDFNEDISHWNTSKVTDMSSMFDNTQNFNQPLKSWNVSEVTNINNMFYSAVKFNQDLSTWTTGIDRPDYKKYNQFACNSLLVNKAYYPKSSKGIQFTKADLDCIYVPDNDNIYTAVNLYLTYKEKAINRYSYIERWNTSKVTNMKGLFANNDYYNSLKAPEKGYYMKGVQNFNEDISGWDTTKVTDLSYMLNGDFPFAVQFNQPLDSWNVSKVTDMNHMFYYAPYFNQPLKSWNVSKITYMNKMFYSAQNFNQPLKSWNVSKVIDMSSMFEDAIKFNQPLKSWNVSKVTDMNTMFAHTLKFNQSLNSWNVSKVTDMNNMFENGPFNQPLDSWNVSKATNMKSIFDGAIYFNRPLKSWDVSKVNNMNGMFNTAKSFNQPLKSWNVSKVIDMSKMFAYTTNFNQPLKSWNVSKVIDMNRMFAHTTNFNQPLKSWNVSKVTNMNMMFYFAERFSQDLSAWTTGIEIIDYSKYNAFGKNSPLCEYICNIPRTFNIEYSCNISVESLNDSNIKSAVNSYIANPCYFKTYGNIEYWNTSNVTTMKGLFYNKENFNADISKWDTSKVNDMERMFYNASIFNQPLKSWNVSKVNYMNNMFYSAQNFNQPLDNWNVSKVIDMSQMFAHTTNFNQPLKSWNVLKVTDMNSMFSSASKFNQDLSTWTTGIDRSDYEKYSKFACKSLLINKAYYPKSSKGVQFTKADLGC